MDLWYFDADGCTLKYDVAENENDYSIPCKGARAIEYGTWSIHIKE